MKSLIPVSLVCMCRPLVLAENEFRERITIESGIGRTIEKEEWRGAVVGNLFYPRNGQKNKAILHFNGGVPLLQDGR